MKINSSSKIIYENLTPYIMRNSSEINTNSNSPIKVRKKLDSLIKVNSAETFKLIKISNQSKQKVLKYKIKSINFNVFIRKNLFKYNSYPFYFYIKISNQLLLNFPNHLVSIFICLFGFLCLIILNISIEINPFNSDYWIYVLFIFPKYILFPLSDVFNEIILRVNFIQPHTLMFLRGICEFPLMVILFFILLILNKEYIDIIIKGNTRNIIFQILLRLIFILLSSFRTFCLMKVLYLYNSQHISFLIIVFSFTNFINGLIKKDIDVYYYIVQFSSFIIIFFGTLIYNEIIIINACGLNDYTKESLLLREKIDKDQKSAFLFSFYAGSIKLYIINIFIIF